MGLHVFSAPRLGQDEGWWGLTPAVQDHDAGWVCASAEAGAPKSQGGRPWELQTVSRCLRRARHHELGGPFFKNMLEHHAHSLTQSLHSQLINHWCSPQAAQHVVVISLSTTGLLLCGTHCSPRKSDPDHKTGSTLSLLRSLRPIKVYFALTENLISSRFPYYLSSLSEAFPFSLSVLQI